MAKNKISEWSSTPANNTDVGGIDIAEGCAPSGINNAMREMMAQIKDMQAGTDGDNFTVGGNLAVTGTSTFTGNITFPTASLSAIYPVGSIYTSTVSTDPATLFGFGTWVAFGAGRVLIGNGGGFTAGSTGGSADATLVSHTHTVGTTSLTGQINGISQTFGDFGSASGVFSKYNTTLGNTPIQSDSNNVGGVNFDATHSHTLSTVGSSATNANLQPYVVVYMWNRTA